MYSENDKRTSSKKVKSLRVLHCHKEQNFEVNKIDISLIQFSINYCTTTKSHNIIQNKRQIGKSDTHPHQFVYLTEEHFEFEACIFGNSGVVKIFI